MLNARFRPVREEVAILSGKLLKDYRKERPFDYQHARSC